MKVNRRAAVSILTFAALLPAAGLVARSSVAEPPERQSARSSDAILWLHLAKREAETETRPDQRAIYLWEVGRWFQYAGDTGTARSTLREAREIYRAMKGSEHDSGLQMLAARMAESGDYPTALETAYEIKIAQTRDWALQDAVIRQTKVDDFTGIWEAMETIEDHNLRMTACSAIAEASVRVGDLAAVERAINSTSRELQIFPLTSVVAALQKKGMIVEAADFERRVNKVSPPVSEEEKVAGEHYVRVMRGEDGTVEEILKEIGSTSPEGQFWMRGEAIRNLWANGRKEDARRIATDSVRFIEEWQKVEPSQTFPPGPPEMSREDKIRWNTGSKLQQMADVLYNPLLIPGVVSSPPAIDLALYLFDQAERQLNAIRRPSTKSAALSSLTDNMLRWREWEQARRIADRIPELKERAVALIRVGREYGWAGDKRQAIATFNAAERVIHRMGPEIVTPDAKNAGEMVAAREQLLLLCMVVPARKRVGDRDGMLETLQWAESLYVKMPSWNMLHNFNHMAEAFAAAGRFEDAKKAAMRCEYAAGRMDGLIRIASTFLPDDTPLSRFTGDGKPPPPMP